MDTSESLVVSIRDLSVLSREKDLCESNREFYDSMWQGLRLVPPWRFNTWPILSPLAAAAPHRLEVGPGRRPRLPIVGTRFIDLSQAAVDRLKEAGGLARVGNINALPFPDQEFDLVCAFDVIEHVCNDQQAFRELSRVLKDGGFLFFSVPIHERQWTDYDVMVGHYRRYEPRQVREMIASNHLILEQSAIYGMMPRSRWWVGFGKWCLRHFRRTAALICDWLTLPIGLRLQQPLTLVPGLLDTTDVEEVLFVCRRVSRARERPSIAVCGEGSGSKEGNHENARQDRADCRRSCPGRGGDVFCDATAGCWAGAPPHRGPGAGGGDAARL